MITARTQAGEFLTHRNHSHLIGSPKGCAAHKAHFSARFSQCFQKWRQVGIRIMQAVNPPIGIGKDHIQMMNLHVP